MYVLTDGPKRVSTNLCPKHMPKSRILKNSLFYKFSDIYTDIPDHIRSLDIKNFRSQIKTHIITPFDPYFLQSTSNESDTETDLD